MANLLAETIALLNVHKKTPADVLWVERIADPGEDTIIQQGTWNDFAKFADYDHHMSSSPFWKLRNHLKIVGDGWWLERRFIGASEWWEMFQPPNYNPNAPALTAWAEEDKEEGQ